MILLRHYTEQDLERVRELHGKQGLSYLLPDLNADTMLVRTVIEENGIITQAAFLRKTAETYLILDPSVGSRRANLGRLLILHKELGALAKQVGFEDVHCWVPPELAERFGKLLLHLGWKKALWPCYSKELLR